ncbi:MAG: glutamate racemase [Defluviitaleaceae bacterium]|nr:glutamate racemase [Defluviitaleaceae bacterium]
MANDNRPIGIFDSGVGGLTVAKQIIATMPNEQIIYFGDSLRMPYGERDADDLEQLSRRIINFLMSKNIKALVVACGSISSKIFDRVRLQVPQGFPVFEMVTPAITATLAATKNQKIGVLATAGTINSGTHERLIKQALPNAEVTAVAAPLFAPLVEEGWVDNDVADMTAKIYLKPFSNIGIDTLLLACTHFPLMNTAIAKALPKGITIIDPAVQLANDICCQIKERAADCRPYDVANEFYVTAKREKFDQIAHLVLNQFINSQFVILGDER